MISQIYTNFSKVLSKYLRVDQLWQMAVTWYSSRLRAESRRPAPTEIRSIFEGIGLHGDFWDPQADTFG